MTDRSSYAIVARYEVTGDEALQYHSIGVACVMGEMLARGPEAPRPRGPEAPRPRGQRQHVRVAARLRARLGVARRPRGGLPLSRPDRAAGRGRVGGGSGVGRSRWNRRSGCGTPSVDCPPSSVEAGASCRCWTVPLRQMRADLVTFACAGRHQWGHWSCPCGAVFKGQALWGTPAPALVITA